MDEQSEKRTDWTVYMCPECEAFHRQLFLLDHAEGCSEPPFVVASVPRPAPPAPGRTAP